jgi:hypothetical membrane protein
MRYVGIPALVSSTAAPIGLVGGWALAAYMWPEYDPIRQTISELAAGDAPTAALMNAMFILAGICHLTSAAFLYAIAPLGRVLLGVGGLASFAVAAFPLPTVVTTSTEHRISAGVSFVALAVWPLFGWRRRPVTRIVSLLPMLAGALVMGALCLWFLLVWSDTGGTTGLIERFAVAAEAIFPAVVAWGLMIGERRRRRISFR